MTYTKTTWVNDQAPAINATNLNHIETGIYDNDSKITETLTTLGVSTNTWSTSGTYSEGDIVVYSNKLYKNITGNYTSTNPASDTTNWQLIKIIDNGKFDIDLMPIDDTYSTAEINTGKEWINAKPIYRKIISLIVGNGNNSYDSGMSNISTIISISGVIDKGDDKIPFGFYTSSDNYAMVFYRTTNNTIETRCQNIYDKPAYIIIEYTKTTD